MITETVLNTIKINSLLEDGSKVAVGFSGGADSSALVSVLHKLGYKVYAIHVHHGIRGQEADRDEAYCKEFCKSNSIIYRSVFLDIPEISKESKLSLETCARIERYKALNQIAEALSCPIAVAHNKNDQAETVLMHLFRGSSLNGLCGIRYKSNNIIRPLLDVTREEIEGYCKAEKINYVTDSTNLINDCSRNVIRNSVLKNAVEVYPGAVEALASCASSLCEYNDYFNSEADALFSKNAEITVDFVKLKIISISHIMFCELIRRAIYELKHDLVDIDFIHIESIYGLINKQSGKEVCLPYLIRVKKVYGYLHFYFEKEAVKQEYEFHPNTAYTFGKSFVSSEYIEKLVKEPNTECLDADKIPENAVLRTRRDGDKIKKLGSGTCSLKEFLIDKKVPQTERDALPILASGSDVLCIPGLAISDIVKITASTKTIIKVYKGGMK